MPESTSRLAYQIDHVIAIQHGGQTVSENLALCCGRCNRSKGPNIAGLDPVTGELTRLFDPRRDEWSVHFRYEGPIVVGLTDVGRTTVGVLGMNHELRVANRAALIEEGVLRSFG